MCPNVCEENHKCNKRSHFPKSCECEVIMERTLLCQHTVKLKCHIDPSEHQCLVDVKRTLLCDHKIILKCHINYEKYMCREIVTCTRDDCGHEFKQECHDITFERKNKCEIKVDKTLKCGHIEVIKCYQNRDDPFFSCKKKCLKQCENSHICYRVCHFSSECHCDVKINKTLPRCGHDILIECSEEVNQLTCCTEQVDFIMERCGHHQKISCSEKHRIETAEPGKRELYEKRIKCREIIPLDLPECGHSKQDECWKSFKIKEAGKYMMKYVLDVYDLKCSKEVSFNLECGHSITTVCYKKLAYEKKSASDMYDLKCSEEVSFNLECGHSITTVCYKKLAYEKKSASTQIEGKAGIECETTVDLNLECGHTTTVKCYEKFRYENLKKLTSLPRGFLRNVRTYTNIKCSTRVDIELSCGHIGQTTCWEKENGTSYNRVVSDCKALVEIHMEQCEHTKMVECYQKHNKFECHENSVYTYPKCGHERYFECSQHPDIKILKRKAQIALRRRGMGRRYNYREDFEYEIPLCEHLMEKQLTCGHKITVKCKMADTAVCNQNCEQILICGHSCSNLCTLCEENITHKKCMRKCGERLFCGHNCNGETCMQCRPCNKVCSFSCAHDICKLNCRDNCVPCKKSCPWKCPHFQCSKLCSEECDRPLCSEDCEHKLTCGHKCPGFCGEPCPVSCEDCDASNFFEGDEGIKTVTIKECGHSFGYIYLDNHMEETANKLTSQCPGCERVVNWHPRYDRILKRKKLLTEELKKNFQKITKQANYIFPLCDSKIFQQFNNYIGSFNTYVQIISYIARDRNNVKIKSFQAYAENISKAMRRTTNKFLQNWIDIYDAIFRLYVKWMLQIITSNAKLLERKFNGKKLTQDENKCAISQNVPEDDISSTEFKESKTSKPVVRGNKRNNENSQFEVIDISAMFEEKSMVCLSQESKSMEIGCDRDTSKNQKVNEISEPEVEEWVTGLDIVRRIEDTMISNQKSEVERLLSFMIPFMRNEPHFTEAIQCPQLTSVTAIGVHEKDWKICKQGHLTSTLIHQNCFTCYDTSTSKVSGESLEGVLWKTHFQHLTEKSDWDKYNQGKGNVIGAQQKRNKRNKSNKNRMPITFEKNTKQTNTKDVRTHSQGSNCASDNFTLQHYINPNTNGGSYKGNSRGQGRGRGNKNQQTAEVAGRPLHTHPVGFQGYNTDFNSPVVRPQKGHSNFIESNFGRFNDGRGTGYNGMWQRNTVPHRDELIPHHVPVAGHNGMRQRNSVPHHEQEAIHNKNWERNVPHQEQVAGFGIHMQQNKINNEPDENFKHFTAGFGRPKYEYCSSDSRPGSRGQRGRGRRGRRGGRGARN